MTSSIRFIAFITSRCICLLIPYGTTPDNKLGNAIGFGASVARPDTGAFIFTAPASAADAPPAPSPPARGRSARPRALPRPRGPSARPIAHRVTARVAPRARIVRTRAQKIPFRVSASFPRSQSSRASWCRDRRLDSRPLETRRRRDRVVSASRARTRRGARADAVVTGDAVKNHASNRSTRVDRAIARVRRGG